MTASAIDVYRDLVFLLAKLVRKPDDIDKLLDLSGVDDKPVIDTQAASWVNWTAAIQSALQHDDGLDKLVECVAQTGTTAADEVRTMYQRCNGADVGPKIDTRIAGAVEDATPTANADAIRSRLGEIRTQRRTLLAAKTVGAAKRAADAIHTNAGTLCAQLDNGTERSAWPIMWTSPQDQEQVLSRIELRLMDVIRWSTYVLHLSEDELTTVDELHPILPDDAMTQRARGATATARLVDAQIKLALETRRLLRTVDAQGAP